MFITSKDNDLIKHIRKLKEKKYRDEFGEFIVEGAKMIEEAINEEVNIKYIVVCEDCKNANSITQEQLYDFAKLRIFIKSSSINYIIYNNILVIFKIF